MPPVEDHPIHESTRKHGINPPCWNNRKPFKPGYYAEDRYYQSDGQWSRIKKWVPHKMTTECQQPGTGYTPDAGCVNCKELKP